MYKNFVDKYFFFLFSIIPISIVVGATASLINILIIVFSFLFYVLKENDWGWLKHKTIKLLLILYAYLIFNSFIALEPSFSWVRNLGFIRFIIFFAAINYFFNKHEYFKKIFLIWFVFFLILTFDIFLESARGSNILGFGNGDRIFSFFKDEPVVGSFMSGFFLLIVSYFFQISRNNEKIKNYCILLLSCTFILAIILTGERSITIKILIAFFAFYLFINNFNFKEKVISLILIVSIFLTLFLNSSFLKMRYFDQFIKLFNSKDAIEKSLNSRVNGRVIYFQLYRSGIEVFKKNPVFGVGNKNYRVETCTEKRHDDIYLCASHPHQIYIELLSEHGLVGALIILSIIFYLLFQILKEIQITRNKIQCAAFLLVLMTFIPLLPSGAFFGDFSLTLFFINFSVMFAINKSSNIFFK